MAKRAKTVKAKGGISNVDYVIPALSALLPQYDLIRDALKGSVAVKAAGVKYLPMPAAHDQSAKNIARYNGYKTRAVFYNVTKRTLSGLVGQVTLVDPIIEVPDLLKPVLKDANGSGVSIEQLAEQAERYVLAYGRAGLFTDYPTTDGKATTRADQLSGRIRPTISLYAPWDIINWRTQLVGSETVLTLVVLREEYVENDDGFEEQRKVQYRVLRLVDGVYTVELWREDSQIYGPYQSFKPTNGKGETIDEIPFTFLGANNNDSIPDDPPMFDLADLNIAHYRNSADYEESVFIVGQPTPYVTGLTEHWLTEVLKGELDFGSRGGIALPEGATTGLVQMEANSGAMEAMAHKEKQMVALGAKLVENRSVQRTATEAGLDSASEASMLTTATNNVSAGFKWSLEWCAIFAGIMTIREDAETDKIKFELNTEFDIDTLGADELRVVVESWQKDALTFTEMRSFQRKAGYATLDDAAAKAEIKKDRDDAMLGGMNDTDDFTPNNPPNDNDENDDADE